MGTDMAAGHSMCRVMDRPGGQLEEIWESPETHLQACDRGITVLCCSKPGNLGSMEASGWRVSFVCQHESDRQVLVWLRVLLQRRPGPGSHRVQQRLRTTLTLHRDPSVPRLEPPPTPGTPGWSPPPSTPQMEPPSAPRLEPPPQHTASGAPAPWDWSCPLRLATGGPRCPVTGPLALYSADATSCPPVSE